MLTTIAIAAAAGFAGLSIGLTGANFRLRGRIEGAEDLALEVAESMRTEMVSKVEISNAFREISLLEQQREQAAANTMNQMWREIVALRENGFRPGGNQVGAFRDLGPSAVGPSAVGPSAAEANSLLKQQLAALNQRIQQVTNQQMPS
jgi:hypothetical protein